MAGDPVLLPLDAVDAPIDSDGGRGRVIALVASGTALSEGWAPGAAHRLAARWAAEGHRIVLADGGLEWPSLHEAAGVPNREGLVDAALYGASAARVSHEMDQGYFLITAGTPTADPVEVLREARWSRFTEGMAEASVNLVLYLRDGDACTPAFLGSAGDIVVLGTSADLPGSVHDLAPLVRAVTGLDGSEPVAAPAPAAAPDTTDSAPVADTDGPAGPGPAAAASEDAAPARPVPTDLRPDTSGGSGRIFLFIVLAILAAAVLGWLLSTGLG